MNSITKYILNSFGDNIEELDICNRHIKGVLDLKRFEYLKKLDCSYNDITDIINMPETLEILKCNNNKIKSLTNRIETDGIWWFCYYNKIFPSSYLPDSIIEINCCFNDIENIDFTKLISLRRLNISHNKIKSIKYLPKFLVELNCIDNFIEVFEVPNSLKIAYCDNNYIKSFDNSTLKIDILTGRNLQRLQKNRV